MSTHHGASPPCRLSRNSVSPWRLTTVFQGMSTHHGVGPPCRLSRNSVSPWRLTTVLQGMSMPQGASPPCWLSSNSVSLWRFLGTPIFGLQGCPMVGHSMSPGTKCLNSALDALRNYYCAEEWQMERQKRTIINKSINCNEKTLN